MICGRSIRAMTAEERDRRDDLDQERYDMVYAQVEEEERKNWEAEFGKGNKRFPFIPNGVTIHNQVVRRIAEQYTE